MSTPPLGSPMSQATFNWLNTVGGCRKFSDEIFEAGFLKQLLKLNLESALAFPDFFREGHFSGPE